MSNSRLLVGALAVLVGCAALVFVAIERGSSRKVVVPVAGIESDLTTQTQIPPAPPLAAPGRVEPGQLAQEPAPPQPPPVIPPPGLPASQTAERKRKPPVAKARPPKKSQPADPAAAEARAVARQALFFVGADPFAEAVWVDAINDPSRTAHERSDLIEDLNEEGFPNPKHPSEDDLPLVENRLALIEDLAPDAMDQVNTAAFAEAYKDLVNMYARAPGE